MTLSVVFQRRKVRKITTNTSQKHKQTNKTSMFSRYCPFKTLEGCSSSRISQFVRTLKRV